MTEFNIPALQIEHISKSFNAGKNPKKALSDVRFSIEQGDFFGLLGPNGAGKSTLIGVLAKTVTPDSGNVSVLGYDIRRDWQQFKMAIGIVLAFYGYSAMKNPNVWGDQGRDEIKPENWNGYVVHNGQFMMYAGFFLAALAALDVIFDFAGWLYILILLGGLAMIFYPLAHWMHEKEGKWWPWPKHKKKK